MEDIRGNTGNPEEEEGKQAPPEAAPGGKTEVPKEEPTLTKTQAEGMVQKARIKGGWDAKALSNREAAVKAGEVAQEAWRKEQRDAELAAAGEDEEAVARVKRKWDLDDREAALKTSEATHAAEIKAANDAKLEITCFTIAGEHGVKPEDLKEAAIEFGLKTEEQIESLAKRMAKGEPPKEPPKRPDSSRTMGGAPELTGRQKMVKGFEQEGK